MCCSSDRTKEKTKSHARTLDCIGLYCPEPLFRTRLEMDSMEQGGVLEILADDPAAEEDLASFADKNGHRILASNWENGILRFLVEKSAGV